VLVNGSVPIGCSTEEYRDGANEVRAKQSSYKKSEKDAKVVRRSAMPFFFAIKNGLIEGGL